MGTIKVNSIKLYAYHGCLEEEAKIGSDLPSLMLL